MFLPGDVVRFFAPSAGKNKYHICVCSAIDDDLAYFIFINSNPGYEGELVYNDGVIDGLPPSKTGKTVISLGLVSRMTSKQLKIFRAEKVSTLSAAIAEEVISTADSSPVLTPRDRARLIDGLQAFVRASTAI